ncbi:MAG: hypothetical protein QOJ72_1085 [Nocardioidaceae bacterium]|jgi:ubiquinone/menaquinone biosynthesis C-methylase UbiE|nr:hypothetical protein [Nocardioidaceae bacterium]
MVSTRTQQVADLFDLVAPTYDQVGVDLFQPIAQRLVELLHPGPGDRAVDLGCGRGALTIPLAEAVGPDGTVTAGDVSPAMVEAAQQATRHLPQVTVEHLDAGEPDLSSQSADIVAASLVIFFLPEPADALQRWVRLLVPGGRIGLTTFGAQDEVWKSVDALFDPYLPADMLDARTSGARGPFGSSDATSELLRSAGLTAVETLVEPLTVSFDDPEMWRRWTMSVGQRRMWGFVPDSERPELFARAAALLGAARDGVGPIRLRQDVRYSLGTAPLS